MLKNRDKRREFLIDLKSKPCTDCGNLFHWCMMEFDHVPGRGKKSFEINQATIGKYSPEEITSELEKCDLVCSNCHKLRTYVRRSHSGFQVGPSKDVCKYGHDFTDPDNQYWFIGTRIDTQQSETKHQKRGCMECRRVNVSAKHHGESSLPFAEKEERYHQRLLHKTSGGQKIGRPRKGRSL